MVWVTDLEVVEITLSRLSPLLVTYASVPAGFSAIFEPATDTPQP